MNICVQLSAFEGEVPLSQLESIVARLVDLGFGGIGLADTTGMANPAQVRRTLEHLLPKFPAVEWTLHTHNTRAMAIPNVLAAMDCGVRHFDSSIGGLGGCPFAPGATGNVCTEDLVHCLHAMGYETGIDLVHLSECIGILNAFLAPRTLGAGPGACARPQGL